MCLRRLIDRTNPVSSLYRLFSTARTVHMAVVAEHNKPSRSGHAPKQQTQDDLVMAVRLASFKLDDDLLF